MKQLEEAKKIAQALKTVVPICYLTIISNQLDRIINFIEEAEKVISEHSKPSY